MTRVFGARKVARRSLNGTLKMVLFHLGRHFGPPKFAGPTAVFVGSRRMSRPGGAHAKGVLAWSSRLGAANARWLCYSSSGDFSISILNPGILLSRKPPKSLNKWIRFLKTTMAEKNGQGIN